MLKKCPMALWAHVQIVQPGWLGAPADLPVWACPPWDCSTRPAPRSSAWRSRSWRPSPRTSAPPWSSRPWAWRAAESPPWSRPRTACGVSGCPGRGLPANCPARIRSHSSATGSSSTTNRVGRGKVKSGTFGRKGNFEIARKSRQKSFENGQKA